MTTGPLIAPAGAEGPVGMLTSRWRSAACTGAPALLPPTALPLNPLGALGSTRVKTPL
ncbi:MAG: hypothetical protein ABI134_17010 [Byssovorax sp.]